MTMDIEQFYNLKKRSIQQEINSQTESYLSTVNIEEFADYLYKKNSLPEIIEDSSRTLEIFENGEVRSGYSDRIEPLVMVKIPYIHNENNSNIVNNLTSNPQRMFGEPFSYDESGHISFSSNADDNRIIRRIADIKEQIGWKNNNIRTQNQCLMPFIKSAITNRIDSIKNKNVILDSLAKKMQVNLIKKEDSQKNLPPSLSVKKSIEALIRPSAKIPEQPVLSSDEFNGLMDLIDNCCRFFERTPGTFTKLGEEDLRNTILSQLNGIYKGNAVGEAFSNSGKTDIYLNLDKGKLFVSECKFWKDTNTIEKTTQQLLGYLTWRESRGVVIIFSRNKNFKNVLDSAYESIPKIPSYVNGIRKLSENHFVASHHKEEDKRMIVEIHYIIYNVYSN